jgi:8-oxo-dGTP pyrophosphatase MutT (NUDIX family)
MAETDPPKDTASVVIPYREGFIYVKTAKDAKWGLPGGKLDPFEPIHVGLPRETKQETNLEILLLHLLGIWDFKSESGSSITNRVFAGKVVEGEPKIIRPNEILELGIFSLSKIRELYRNGEIRAGRANLEPVEEYILGTNYPLSIIHTLF